MMLTIGMPVYNDAPFIAESLKSILGQSYSDFILVISDDCSTDGSTDICKSFATVDDRIRYIRHPRNIGISKNMGFLLKESQTKYFMWAADDDLWAPDFVENLIRGLENHPEAVVAFCNYQEIDEEGNYLGPIKCFDYSEIDKTKRLKKFIRNPDDQFGYGVFITKKIKGVEFPVWWWPNRRSAYNNIFPTLCYYLSKGNYLHYTQKPLFFKRVKTIQMHHLITGRGNAIMETFAYVVRRFNLVVFSSKQIRRAANIQFMLQTFPALFYCWFIKSSWVQFTLAGRSFWKNKIIKF